MRSSGWVLVFLSISLFFNSRSAGQWVDAFNPNPYSAVYSILVQPDGKILIGGAFGYIANSPRTYLARVNRDGTLENGFAPVIGGSFYPYVYSLALQNDGKIVFGGAFVQLWGKPGHGNVGRLNPDGSLDPTFNTGIWGSGLYPVVAIVVQNTGKIVIGGTERFLARLNADGSLDATFTGSVGNSGSMPYVHTLVLQQDGKILVGGWFTSLNGHSRNSLGRLNPDGTLDSDFNPDVGAERGSVHNLMCQPDAKILVAGKFTTLCGEPRASIGRLNADGTLDATFSAAVGGANPVVHSVAVQADGKIVVAGEFDTLSGHPCSRLGRINQDGSFDATFNVGANSSVYCLTLQADDSILVGGAFTNLAGAPRWCIGRISQTDLRPSLKGSLVQSNTLHLNWHGVSNGAYKIQFKTNLLQQNWVDVADQLVAQSTNISVALPVTNGQGFFRAVYQR